MRQSGILLHITSLPGPEGIGTLGKSAYAFADFLKSSGMSVWQVLPISPTGYGESPYQSFSTFAGNPDFIDLQLAHAVRDPLGRAYNRTAHLQERKKMMQCWSDYLDWLRCASPGTDLSEPPANLKFKGAGR